MKKIAVLGTGIVGNTIGKKLLELGHSVMMGSRTSTNEKARLFASESENASSGSFGEAAAFGDMIINCTKGEVSLEIVRTILKQNLEGKTFIDIANPLDFSNGMPPTLIDSMTNKNSLAAELQKAVPHMHVVKTLNTVNCFIMADPKQIGDISMFMCGNNEQAKRETVELLQQFGWEDIIDLGDISRAASTEMMLPIWLSLYLKFQHADFGFKIVRKK